MRTLKPGFCGKPHRIEDGKPLGHACFVLQPALLEDEANGIVRGVDPRKLPLVEHKGLSLSGEETAPATHDELCRRAGIWLRERQGCSVVLVDHQGLRTQEQPDAIGWKSASVSYLVECKTSRADFLADKKKPFRAPGLGMGNYRYFLCLPDVIRLADVPAPWGLLYLETRGVLPVKKAAFVPIQDSPGGVEERAILLHCLERVAGGWPLDSLLRKEKS